MKKYDPGEAMKKYDPGLSVWKSNGLLSELAT